jgi:hypothetical protein
MKQNEPANPRDMRAEGNSIAYHGSAIAAEMCGYSAIGMKSEAMQIVRKVLSQRRILPEEFGQALCTIGMHADNLKKWKPIIEAAYNRQSRQFKGKVRAHMLMMYPCLEEWQKALQFVSVRKPSTAADIFHGMAVLLKLEKLEEAEALAARCKKALSKPIDRFDASLLIEARASFCARTHRWSEAIELWSQAPLEEPFRRNALSGIVELYLACAYESAEIGLSRLAELTQNPDQQSELSLPGNDLALTRDAEKELLKFKRGIEKLLPESARKKLGISATTDPQYRG